MPPPGAINIPPPPSLMTITPSTSADTRESARLDQRQADRSRARTDQAHEADATLHRDVLRSHDQVRTDQTRNTNRAAQSESLEKLYEAQPLETPQPPTEPSTTSRDQYTQAASQDLTHLTEGHETAHREEGQFIRREAQVRSENPNPAPLARQTSSPTHTAPRPASTGQSGTNGQPNNGTSQFVRSQPNTGSASAAGQAATPTPQAAVARAQVAATPPRTASETAGTTSATATVVPNPRDFAGLLNGQRPTRSTSSSSTAAQPNSETPTGEGTSTPATRTQTPAAAEAVVVAQETVETPSETQNDRPGVRIFGAPNPEEGSPEQQKLATMERSIKFAQIERGGVQMPSVFAASVQQMRAEQRATLAESLWRTSRDSDSGGGEEGNEGRGRIQNFRGDIALGVRRQQAFNRA